LTATLTTTPIDKRLKRIAGLETAIRGDVRREVALARLTTYGVGGPAMAVATPVDRDDLVVLLRRLEERETPWVVLGGGSNVLVADAGFPGVVIRLGQGFRGVRVLGPSPGASPRMRIRASAGMRLSTLVTRGVKEGLSDLVGLSGIPGTVGGAVAGNAGTPQGEVSSVAIAVELASARGLIEVLPATLKFGYRLSSLPKDAVVTALTF